MDRDALVEKMAEKLWQAESLRAADRRRLVPWSEANEPTRQGWRFMARAALAVAEPVIRNDCAAVLPLAVAEERAECAKVAMEYPVLENETAPTAHARVMQGLAIAVAIRSRGELR